MYNSDSTIRELLADGLIAQYLDLVFPKAFLEMVPERHRDKPLKELPELVKMPWGIPYLSFEVLDAVKRLYELKNDKGIECIPLWKEAFDKEFFPKPENSKESACLFLYKDTFRGDRPVALIAPGGAYTAVSIAGEGMDTADILRNAGYAVAVLNYRCCPNDYPAPQEDLALAVKFIRANAEKLRVNGEDLLVIGYSAGGHLAASGSLYASEIEETLMRELRTEAPLLAQKYDGISVKPDKLCLAYPLTGDDPTGECFCNLVGSKKELIEKMVVYRFVDESYPACFLWACEDDPLVPISNSTKMADALREVGVPYALRLYPTGGHGFGIAKGTSAEGCIEEMIRFFR